MRHLSDGGLWQAGGRLAAYLPHGTSLPEDQWRRRHRGMLTLLWAHAVGLPVVALLYGFPLWHSLLEGSAVGAFAAFAALRIGSRRAQSLVVVLGLLTSSAVLVHITGGLIEAHFHYFVMVAVLALYEDWLPFVVAVAFVLLQHGIMAAFVDHNSVFNHPGSAWKWAAVHSAFIAALGVACIANWRANERQRGYVASLVDALAEGVVMMSRDGRVLAANPSAERILGLPASALGAANGSDPRWTMLRPDGTPLPDDERPTRVTARTGEPRAGALLGLRHQDGSVRWLSESSHALRGGPHDRPPYPVVMSFTDVTEEREALEALERSNADLQQFAYIASHDLSEPLRMVSSYLQLLRRRYRGRLDNDADEFIDYAVDGASRMRSLIEDLLAYSRAGRETATQPVDLGVVIADTLRTLAAAIVDARAEVHVGDLPVVAGDPGQLGQLYQNLLANALKFRRGEHARVWVDAVPAQGQPGVAVLSVADAGIGIEERHRERIFKMFQRLHDRDAYEGTGIGLAICRKIVERHGGRIWAEEREGGGAVFRFTLPTAVAPEEAPPREREAASAV